MVAKLAKNYIVELCEFHRVAGGMVLQECEDERSGDDAFFDVVEGRFAKNSGVLGEI